jgi:hypothetical protein
MADIRKPGERGGSPHPAAGSEPGGPTPAGLRVKEHAGFFPRHVYEPPQKRSRFRSFRAAYGVYGVYLIVTGLLASFLGWGAYRLDHEHFWFHVCIELAIAGFMLVLTVMFIERMLEYRREQERKDRWALIRDDTFRSLETVLQYIIRFSVDVLLDEPTPSSRMQHTSSAYYEVEQRLRKKSETLEEANDAEAMQAWAHKITVWHDTLAPVFNLLRTVTVPRFLHSTSNRTLLRIVLGLEATVSHSEIFMIDLGPRPDWSTAINAKSIAVNLGGIAVVVNECALIQWYLEQTKIHGVKDIDDWAEY